MDVKSASLQLPPTDPGSALGGHTKQVCIKHRISTNCGTDYWGTVAFTEGTPELQIQWPKRLMTLQAEACYAMFKLG